ncbi:MAG: PEP-CTERM sorting domain-containing protein [Planctomycetaceae bacterium]|nr:PEP-CTERM sorting domain-containing protein [Planctomycetaceae bacterium]
MKTFNHLLCSRLSAVLTAGLFLSVATGEASAFEYLARFTGEVTEVVDDLNWFADSINVGTPIEGMYNFFDPGYEKQIYFNDSSEVGYRYFFATGGNSSIPVLPVKMNLAIGGYHYTTSGGPVYYAIRVLNDSTGFVVGDAYSVQSPLEFPIHFTDWTGDPVNDPDGVFYPYLGMGIDLVDPTGTALSSTDLPLSAPPLSKFASATGQIYIADGNGEPSYAEARFRIKTLQLQVVPEPSQCVLATIAFAAGVLGLKNSPRRRSISRSTSRSTTPTGKQGALAVVVAACIAGGALDAGAADYVLTASGPFESAASQSYGFDGATNVEGHLPSLYDATRLAGGSFKATYRFTATDPPASGNVADYDFGELQGLSYELLDSSGSVVHVGGNSSAHAATVFNNFDFAGTTRDTVNFVAFVNSVSGLSSPPALYQSQADFFAIQSFLGFTGAVTGGADYITGLSVPLSPSTYLGFPNRTFRTSMSFNDGDTLDFLEPYQYVESSVQYLITEVKLTAVPEPGSIAILGFGLLSATCWRQLSVKSARARDSLQ